MIRKYSTKRAALEREYLKTLKVIYDERDHCCAGCGTWSGRRTPSHRIPRNYRIDLLPDPDNIDIMCDDCHELVELGHYDELDNGAEIAEYIQLTDNQYYQIKISKRKENERTQKQYPADWTPW